MSVTLSQNEQYQDPETDTAKWNSAIIHCIIYTCAFPNVICVLLNLKSSTGFFRLTMICVNTC